MYIHVQHTKAYLNDVARQVAVDFFGRPIAPKDQSENGGCAKGGVKTKPYRVAYKFNEGNSAAVRKPVKVSAFL